MPNQSDGPSLRRFRRRIRLLRVWRLAVIGASAGACVGLSVSILDYANAVYARPWMLWAPVALGAVIGVVRALTERLSDTDIARSVDKRAGLDDRLTTAIEPALADGPMMLVQRADARQALEDLSPSRLYRFRLSRWHAALCGLGALTVAIFLMGNSPLFKSPQQRDEAAELKARAKEVERVVKPVVEAAKRPEATAEDKDLARQLDRFAADMKRARMSRQEALAKANDLADQARKLEQSRATATAQSIQEAQTAADRLGKMAANGRLEKSDAMRLAEQSKATQDAIADMEQRLAGAKAGKNGMSEAQRRALEAKLGAARKQLESIKLSQRAEEMMRRLAANKDYQEAQRLLQKLAESAAQQKSGAPSEMTKEQMEEAARRLEELARRLNSEAALREYAQKMLEAAKNARLCKNGNCSNPLLAACGLSGSSAQGALSLGGKGRGGVSNDKWVGAHGSLSIDDKSSLLKVKFSDRVVTSQIGGKGPETYTEVVGPSAPGGKTGVPYQNVLPQYRKAAESALNKEDIPPRLRGKVRNYFNSLRQ